MNIKMTEALNAAMGCSRFKDSKLPIKTAYKLSRLSKELSSIQDFYREQLNSFIETYGARDASGQLIPTADKTGIQIIPEKIPEAQDKINSLFNLEVGVPDIFFSLEELESLECTVDELRDLMPFIKEQKDGE